MIKLLFLEFVCVFFSGAVGYGCLETLWRGHTHWTMLALGGICACVIYIISTRMHDRLWKKWLMCAMSITALEFAVGCAVNLRLGWHVWDYSDMPGNFMGQICPLFSFFWLLLSIPCVHLSRLLRGVLLRIRKTESDT